MDLMEKAKEVVQGFRAKAAAGEITELAAVNATMGIVEFVEAITPDLGVPGSDVLCDECAKVFCPHAERLHFDKDGCPACEPLPATDHLQVTFKPMPPDIQADIARNLRIGRDRANVEIAKGISTYAANEVEQDVDLLIRRAEGAEGIVGDIALSLIGTGHETLPIVDAVQQLREDLYSRSEQCADHQRGENAALNRIDTLEVLLRDLLAMYGPSTDYDYKARDLWQRAEAVLKDDPSAT